MIWHHMSTWVCGLARGHMERRRGLAIVFTLRIQLDCKHSWYRWHEFQSWWIVNQEFEARKETKQSQVLTRSWMWSGSELVVVVVWIGSGSVWIRVWIGPEVDPHVRVRCSLDAAWQEKDDKVCRQQECSLAAWQAGLTTCNSVSLAVWQLGCATVDSLAAGLLDCLAA